MVDVSLIKKLGIKSKQQLLILNAPDGYAEQIGAILPTDVELISTTAPTDTFDIVIQFVHSKVEVEKDTPKAITLPIHSPAYIAPKTLP